MIRSRYRLSQGIVPIDENHISIVSIWRHRHSPASATVRQAGAMARLNASRAVFQPIESRKAHDPRAAADILIAGVARHRPVRAQSPKSRREQPYKNALPEPVALPAAIFAVPAVGLTQCGSCYGTHRHMRGSRWDTPPAPVAFRNFPPGLCLSRRRKVAWRALRKRCNRASPITHCGGGGTVRARFWNARRTVVIACPAALYCRPFPPIKSYELVKRRH